MSRIAFKSLSERGILQKLIISILLMAILPLVLIIYILHTESSHVLGKWHIRLLIFFMVSSIVVGYILSRRIMISVIQLVKDVQDITSGNLDKRVEAPDKDEINMLAQYFNQITDELQRNIEDLKESKRLIQNVLSRIGNAMTSAEKVESILALTLETLTNAVKAKSGLIMLKEDNTLRILVSYGLNRQLEKSIRLKEGEGIIGISIKNKKTQNISFSDLEATPLEKELGLANKSIMCIPLVFKEKIVGVLSMQDKKDEVKFNEDDVVLIENMAGQTAIAIENKRLNQDIERTYLETISTLALAVEAKDPYTRGHSKRVIDYAMRLADEFSLNKNTKKILRDAALLHDIGKIGIKDEILLKPGKLTPEERKQMQLHPLIGENILRPIHSLKNIAYLVRHHHERVDGQGYPDGLPKEELTLPLKILTVADAYDAMTSDRPYRKALSRQEAIDELKEYTGSFFDPKVVEAFTRLIQQA